MASFPCVCEFKLMMQFRSTLVTMSTTSCCVSNIVLVLIVDKMFKPKLKLLMLQHDRLSYISVIMYSSTFFQMLVCPAPCCTRHHVNAKLTTVLLNERFGFFFPRSTIDSEPLTIVNRTKS